MNEYPPILAPDDIPVRFAEGWNERDPDKIAAIFDQDADFVNVVGIWWENRDDIREAHDYGLRVIFNDSVLKTGKVKIRYLSESVAVVHARMRLSGQTPVEGNDLQERRNIFTFVVHKGDNGWSCSAAQNTDIVPGKETNAIIGGEFQSVDYRKKPSDRD
jgi:uncharacterized protein (TIGR02246 family)